MGGLYDAFELCIEKPEAKCALTTAVIIAGAYIAGGFVPVAQYLVIPQVPAALIWSAVVKLIARAIS